MLPARHIFFLHHFERQSVATIQLTPEEAEEYRRTPVVLDFRTGFYVFPVSYYLSFKFSLLQVDNPPYGFSLPAVCSSVTLKL